MKNLQELYNYFIKTYTKCIYHNTDMETNKQGCFCDFLYDFECDFYYFNDEKMVRLSIKDLYFDYYIRNNKIICQVNCNYEYIYTTNDLYIADKIIKNPDKINTILLLK